MENIEVKPKRKRQINPDRIVLEQDTLAVVKRIANQIEKGFGGVIKLTNKEIANFLIQSRGDELSAAELTAIKDRYFDDVRAAQWAVNRLKMAKNAGQQITLAEILSELQMPMVMDKKTTRKPKVEKEKRASADGPNEIQRADLEANRAT